MSSSELNKITAMIYTVRGQRVMLDSDLAKLYGVENKRLLEQVKRNLDRFPEDFMIIPNSSELADLRSQIATLGQLTHENPIFKYTPRLFTANGIAMLSSVLKSKEAVQVNISIMRIFTNLKQMSGNDLITSEKLEKLEKTTSHLFKIVFERLDELEDGIPAHSKNRKKIGF